MPRSSVRELKRAWTTKTGTRRGAEGHGVWYGIADDCTKFSANSANPCVALKTKQVADVQTYLNGLGYTINVSQFMKDSDLAIVIRKAVALGRQGHHPEVTRSRPPAAPPQDLGNQLERTLDRQAEARHPNDAELFHVLGPLGFQVGDLQAKLSAHRDERVQEQRHLVDVLA